MSKPEFYLKDGKTLTKYGLACGYIIREEAYGRWKEIYMEHEHYHVRTGEIGKRYEIWETFSSDELTKAREMYRKIDLRPWETERFIFHSDAKAFQKARQRDGYRTRMIAHLGRANPYYEIKYYI